MGDRMLRPRKVSLLTPQVRSQEGDVLTNAGSQLQQHVVAAQLGKQLRQSAYRGARASLPGVQQPASGVRVCLQLPDLQVLKVHLLRQRGPVGRHLCPHVQEQRQAAPHSHVESSQGKGGCGGDRGRRPRGGTSCSHGGRSWSLSAVGSHCLPALPLSPTAPAPPRRLSLSEKRRPALQSGAPSKSAEAGVPTSTLAVSRRVMWGRKK
ncbi:uncharacterized protein LOC101058262 [Pan troglodytes]|uniref:Uncharacterized protein n=1 Tax=Pan troglodytes TaxID=9598 RepID=G2HGE6_PANTR|nr:uncharacterized protein LOC101058262 [Pan troglodytes]BAK62804.1 hypothetical protein [Pan troglodytes]